MLELQRLAKRAFNQEPSKSPYTFCNITKTIEQAERIALIGASGQGKSTLLRTISLLNMPDEGEMSFDGVAFREVGPRNWRKQICYVAQQAVMLPGSVEANLTISSKLHGRSFDLKLAERLLQTAGLSGLDLKKNARDLSGGEMQRIALIRALLLRPKVLLLDEITASLDTVNTKAVEQLLAQWHADEGTTMLWVTHELEQVTRTCERVWFMSGNTIMEDSLATAFFTRPSTDAGRTFIGHHVSEEVQP
ncbi:ABC transporter ATP-binding protein [Paenibacillus aestuarii]|uniref:ATP-binding cassette domain-containing protein n=1 Tax=Paenibacillus aestuarii TaxID=516965 RepID=A0ABW0K7D5_9BACL|nr:ATP-binding cassette domain-containing protein [Paenibacillus aestuarii]